MEQIRVYDASLRPEGTMDRKEAHIKGRWHKTFHCWIISSLDGGSLLFQLRASDKKNYPSMLDISAAGHLIENEEDKDGIREAREELGISIKNSDLHYLGYRVEVDDQDNGQKNREYQAVYLAKIEKNLNEYNPQISEVSGLMWIKIEDALKLFNKEICFAPMKGIAYNKELGAWKSIEKQVSLRDFIPRIQNYYLTISIMAQRLINEEYPLAIS